MCIPFKKWSETCQKDIKCLEEKLQDIEKEGINMNQMVLILQTSSQADNFSLTFV